MEQPTRRPDQQPETVIAVRNHGGPGWQMLSLECSRQDLARRAAEIGLGDVEYRLVSTYNGGWHRDRETGAWFPIEEPLPGLPGTPVHAEVSLHLKSIAYGWIAFAVEAGGVTLDLAIDDLLDSLVLWVRFVQVLAAGGEPHANLANRVEALFVVQNGPSAHLCRLSIESRDVEGEAQTIDVLTDRQKLLQEFCDLMTAIAEHPNFAHHFSSFAGLPDDEANRVDGAAELEWAEGVKEGRFPDDFDAQEEFAAARIAAEVVLPDDYAEFAEKERAMLRSLEIPDEWFVSHGLARWMPASAE
jgi:hypothetical protein